jgi:restriction system protein
VYGNGAPMHYRAITKLALDLELISTKGQTPEATMNGQLTTEIARAASQGTLSRFVAHGQGLYGLSAWLPTGVVQAINAHNATVRDHLMTTVMAMTPAAFEGLVGDLLGKMGFEDVSVTQLSGDGGIDVRATLVVAGGMIRLPYAVQVKRWKHNVHTPQVQALRGSLDADEHGLLVTTSKYSAGAVADANAAGKRPIALINGQQLIGLLVEHGFGVQSSTYRLLEMTNPGWETTSPAQMADSATGALP